MMTTMQRGFSRLLTSATLFAMPIMVSAQEAPPAAPLPGTISPDGTVIVPSFALPPSPYLSPEALAALPRKPTDPEAPMLQALAAGKAGEMRAAIPRYMAQRVDRLKSLYPVTTETTQIAGVPAIRIRPVAPMPTANRRKVLLNLPGGGFVMGAAGGTGMMESIPLSALAEVEIVSITYRQAPEARFPAASEDVTKVYRDLLKSHRPQDIAIFGCSAGGQLAAQALATFARDRLPMPAAAGIFCASGDARWVGDSRVYARPFQALPPRSADLLGYYEGADLASPFASPVLSPALLAKFPPSLIISATRAMELSGAVNMHRELVKAGAKSDLHVWDGLGHAFFYDVSLPESREAFDVMARFFRAQLKLTEPAPLSPTR